MNTIYQTKAEALATEQRIRNIATSAYLGIATTTTTPPPTGAVWYRVMIAGTYTNFSGIVVSAADLDIENGVANNEVILEVNNGVASKEVRRVKGDPPPISQIKGVSETLAISQKAFTEETNGLLSNITYVLCSTPADVTIKEITIPNFKGQDNFISFVRFQYANTAEYPQLSINGGTPRYIYINDMVVSPRNTWGTNHMVMITAIQGGNDFIILDIFPETIKATSLYDHPPISTTSSEDANKIITSSGWRDNRAGRYMFVRFPNINTAANATLDINGLGAKPIYLYEKRVSDTNTWIKNDILLLYYTGTVYVLAPIFAPDTLKTNNLEIENTLNSNGIFIYKIAGESNYISKNNGVMIYTPDVQATDYIDLKGYNHIELIQMVVPLDSAVGSAFYSDKTEASYISGFSENGGAFGNRRKTVKVPEGAKYLRVSFWKHTVAPGLTIPNNFYIKGYNATQEVPNDTILLKKTSYIATTRNFILKEESGNLIHSKDLGKTWQSLPNTIGNIVFVHWFKDGTCLMAGNTKVYFTKNWTSLTESNVLDANGSAFTGTNKHFFDLFYNNSKYVEINGIETLIWADYGGPSGYVSRLWMSQDNGVTVKCILKSGESIVGGSVFSIRHFHHSIWDDYENCLWVTTGDSASQCHILKGVFSGGVWVFEKMVTGAAFKFGRIMYDKDYLYFVTDFTEGTNPTGIMGVPKNLVNDINSYFYLYSSGGLTPYTQYLQDSNGHRVILPDGVGYNKLWYANKDFNFVQKTVTFEGGGNLTVGMPTGSNYNGEMAVISLTGYDITDLKWNHTHRFMLSDGMRAAGYKNFGKIDFIEV